MRRLSLQLLLINPEIGTQRGIAFRLVGKSAMGRSDFEYDRPREFRALAMELTSFAKA
jgi:hypothetical protein